MPAVPCDSVRFQRRDDRISGSGQSRLSGNCDSAVAVHVARRTLHLAPQSGRRCRFNLSSNYVLDDGFINRQTDWTRKSNCRVSSRLCVPHQRIGADWVQIQTEALRVLSCALEARCPWTMVSVFPFSGNDSLDPPHRELNSIRKLIAGVLRPIPMNDEKPHLLIGPVLGLTI